MSEPKIPELRICKDVDGCWVVAIADRFGWVELGTGEPLGEVLGDQWTPLVAEPAAPRVFFPGDWLPFDEDADEGVTAIGQDGTVYTAPRLVRTVDGPVVELIEPSEAEWQSIVDHARAAREGGDSRG